MSDGDSPRLRLLGPVSVRADGVAPLGGATARRLLAVLVLNRNSVVHIDQLCRALWGEDLPETAVASLRSHVSRLRRLLPEGVVLESVVPGYRLQVAHGDLDVDCFEVLLAGALRVRSAEPVKALEALDRALELWQGDALAEFADEWWAHGEATRLEELRASPRSVEASSMRSGDAREAPEV